MKFKFPKYILMIFSITTFSLIAQDIKSFENNNVISRINSAYNRGEIDYATALANKAFAVLDQSQLDPRFYVKVGEIIKCGTPVMMELMENWDKLSVQSQEKIDHLLKRSIDRYDAVYISPDGNFNIHYDTTGIDAVPLADANENGIPDYVETFGDIFNYVWDIEVIELEYDAPMLGGNGMQEVYIENLPSNILGYVSGVDNLQVRNSYSQYGNQLALMQVTAAHEFHHEIQLSIHYPSYPSTWYMETTSVYMEDYVYDDVNDYVGYLYDWYNSPWVSITDSDGMHWYSTSIWNFYLEETFGVDIIREVWEYPNANSIKSLDSILTHHDTSLPDEYEKFETWNYFTGYRSNWHHDTFSEASSYPTVSMQKIHSFSASTSGFTDQSVTSTKYPQKLACNYIKFINSGSDGILLIRVYGDADYSWGGYAITDSTPSHYSSDYPIIYENGHDGIAIITSWSELNNVVLIPTNVHTIGGNTGRAYTYSAEVVGAVVFLSDFMVEELLGNGNGSLESDETARLVVSVSNYGNDLNNVSLEISTEDSCITVTEGDYYIGNFPKNTTQDNESDPFTFLLCHNVEPQEVLFTLSIKENGDEIASEEIRFNIGFSPVLFVDDDNGTDDNDVIALALDSLGLIYDSKDISETGYINLCLNLRDIVIWSVGTQTSGLTDAEIDSLEILFNSDVNVLLTGGSIGEQLSGESWCPFIPDEMTSVGWLKGVEGDILGQSSNNWIWATAPVGGNEKISPVDPRAIVSFAYLNSQCGGVIRYRDQGRFVASDFSFSAMTQPSSAFIYPKTLLEMTLDYFDNTNHLPSVFDLYYPSIDTIVIINDLSQSIVFNWEQSTDADGVTYTFVLDECDDFRGEFLYEAFDISTETSTFTADEIYDVIDAQSDTLVSYWGVYASDGKEVRLSSGMNKITFILDLPNLAPSSFVLIDPDIDNNLIVSSMDSAYHFIWESSSDPEGDNITYNWILDIEETLNEPNFRSIILADTVLAFASDTLLSWLPEGQDSLAMWWTVIASDGENVTSTDTVGFYLVIDINQPPGDFVLIAPAADSELVLTNFEDSLKFQWTESIDPEGENILYNLVIDYIELGKMVLLDTTIADTELTIYGDDIFGFFPDGTDILDVFWCVIASDGEQEVSSNVQDLTLIEGINEAPSDFAPISPENSDTLYLHPIYGEVIEFKWEKSIDPDNDTLIYTLSFFKEVTIDTVNIFQFSTGDTIVYFTPQEIIALMGSADTLDIGWYVSANDGEFSTLSNEIIYIILVDLTQVSIYDKQTVPTAFCLHDNYPNPFNPSTKIFYELPHESIVEFAVYDLLGNKVMTLVFEKKPAGSYSVEWNGLSDNGKQMPTGLYIYRIMADNFISYKKMLLMK